MGSQRTSFPSEVLLPQCGHGRGPMVVVVAAEESSKSKQVRPSRVGIETEGPDCIEGEVEGTEAKNDFTEFCRVKSSDN